VVVSLSRGDREDAKDVVDATSPVTGKAVDISGLGPSWEIAVHILFLTELKRVLFHVQDSDDGFATWFPGPTFNPAGEVKTSAPRKYIARSTDYPSLRFGQPGAQLRLSLVALDPDTQVRYTAFLRTTD
jgi:hypothetical protein